jgi:hypothetical protein
MLVARSSKWRSAVFCKAFRAELRVRVIAIVAFATAATAWAPCVVFAPDWPGGGGGVGSVGQHAIYVIREGGAARYRVTLIPRVKVRGNPNDVGILIPTPSVPEFQTVASNVFDEASLLTQPLWRQRSRSSFNSGCGFPTGDLDGAFDVSGEDDVTVVSRQTVGDFDVVVLSAQTSAAIIEWLDEAGFAHGVDDDSALDGYVASGWLFTAMRRLDANPEAEDRVFVWQTDPVAMSYDADEVVYPMGLTAISASGTDATRVLIYAIADERLTFDGAETVYANRISSIELGRIRDDAPNFGSLLTEGAFLTRLKRDYAVFEDKPDFTLDETGSTEFREVRFASLLWFGVGDWYWVAPLAAWMFVGRVVRRRRVSRA